MTWPGINHSHLHIHSSKSLLGWPSIRTWLWPSESSPHRWSIPSLHIVCIPKLPVEKLYKIDYDSHTHHPRLDTQHHWGRFHINTNPSIQSFDAGGLVVAFQVLLHIIIFMMIRSVTVVQWRMPRGAARPAEGLVKHVQSIDMMLPNLTFFSLKVTNALPKSHSTWVRHISEYCGVIPVCFESSTIMAWR